MSCHVGPMEFTAKSWLQNAGFRNFFRNHHLVESTCTQMSLYWRTHKQCPFLSHEDNGSLWRVACPTHRTCIPHLLQPTKA